MILAESALEIVPKEIQSHPSVLKHAKSVGSSSSRILLDRSFHHSAMFGLQESYKRGRPDLVHFAVLEATSTPLYLDDKLHVFVHTYGDLVIRVGNRVRLPKSYFRFEGLMQKLFEEGSIVSGKDELLRLERQTFRNLIESLGPDLTLGLSRLGSGSTCEEVAKTLASKRKSTIVVGGFPRSHFSKRVSEHLDALYAVHKYPLEAHAVIARLIYEYEKIHAR